MNQTQNVEERVLQILREKPETRADDMALILAYYGKFGRLDVKQLSFYDVVMTYKVFGLPCFETILRARRRVQALCPEVCRGSASVKKHSVEDGLLILVPMSE